MRILALAPAAITTVLFAATAWAADLATGPQINAAIAGNIVQGSMVDSGVYTEFYAADGSIHGNGDTGQWHVTDAEICFCYSPDAVDCWGVLVDGDAVSWIKDGTVLGIGMIVSGNPNGF